MIAHMEPRQTRGLSPRVEGDPSRKEVRAWGAGECGDPRGREDTGALMPPGLTQTQSSGQGGAAPGAEEQKGNTV